MKKMILICLMVFAIAGVAQAAIIGVNFTEVNDGTGDTFLGNQTEVFYTIGIAGTPVPDGLVAGTTYYWRIDEVEADGTINRGDVWSFTVPSLKAYNHNLPDGAKLIETNTGLSWTPGSGAKLHTVFFGESYDEVNNAVISNTRLKDVNFFMITCFCDSSCFCLHITISYKSSSGFKYNTFKPLQSY